MATVILVQEDTAPTCTAAQGCSGLTDTQGPIEEFAQSAGTAGVTENASGNFPNSSALIRRTAYFDCLTNTAWTTGAGTWTMRINHTTGDADVFLQEIWICRFNSACANQETIGSLTSINQATNVAQPVSHSVSGSAVTLASGDRVFIILGYDNTAAHGNHAIGITPNQNIDTPWDDGVSGWGRLLGQERFRLVVPS